MKPLKTLTPVLSVTGDVAVYDISQLAGQGFKTIINNRPDGEEPGQATSAELAAEATKHGVAYVHIPVISGGMTPQNVDDFARVFAAAAQPVAAFCRSGTRSTTLWALSQAANMDTDTILKTAAAAGYDLSGLKPELERRKAA